MDYKKAHKIINTKFNTSNKTNDWFIIKENGKLSLRSEKEHKSVYLSNNKFIEDYLFKFNISSSGLINGAFRLTSIGLVSEEEYQLAIDMTSTFLSQYELKDFYIYSGVNGKEYIYVNNLEIILLYFNKDEGSDIFTREIEYMDFLVEIKEDEFNVIKYRKEVKLISERGRFKDISIIKEKILKGKDYYKKYTEKVSVIKSINNKIKVLYPVDGHKFRSIISYSKVAINNNSFKGKECYLKIETEGNIENCESISSYDFLNYGFYTKKINNFKFIRKVQELIVGKTMFFSLEDTCEDKYYYIEDDPVPF